MDSKKYIKIKLKNILKLLIRALTSNRDNLNSINFHN